MRFAAVSGGIVWTCAIFVRTLLVVGLRATDAPKGSVTISQPLDTEALTAGSRCQPASEVSRLGTFSLGLSGARNSDRGEDVQESTSGESGRDRN